VRASVRSSSDSELQQEEEVAVNSGGSRKLLSKSSAKAVEPLGQAQWREGRVLSREINPGRLNVLSEGNSQGCQANLADLPGGNLPECRVSQFQRDEPGILNVLEPLYQ
jgi:hypothetical protein